MLLFRWAIYLPYTPSTVDGKSMLQTLGGGEYLDLSANRDEDLTLVTRLWDHPRPKPLTVWAFLVLTTWKLGSPAPCTHILHWIYLCVVICRLLKWLPKLKEGKFLGGCMSRDLEKEGVGWYINENPQAAAAWHFPANLKATWEQVREMRWSAWLIHVSKPRIQVEKERQWISS